MTKGLEVIYSRQETDYVPGRAYSNPRFFTTPRSGVTKVYLVGDWPRIRDAYEALGVPVERLDASAASHTARNPAEARAPASLTPTAQGDERNAIYIPDDWADLPWSRPAEGRDLTLRGLAAMFSAAPVLNKADARRAIVAELARRAELPAAGSPDEEAANGLTRRELSADLEAAGVDPDPTADIEALAATRDEARG